MQCKQCGKCCRTVEGPIVLPSDVKRIAKKMEMSQGEFLHKFCKKEYIFLDEKRIELYFLKIIHKQCIFLTEDNLCSIYHYRPHQCIYAPYNFMANYDLWKHMPCVQKTDFDNCDSKELDKRIFSELLTVGYGNCC